MRKSVLPISILSFVFLAACGDTFEERMTLLGLGSDTNEGKQAKSLDLSGSPIILDTVPFIGGKNGYKVYRAPTMVVSKKGTVLAFAEGRVNGHADEDDMDVVLRRSFDGGKTWQPIQVLENDGKNPCKNQSPVVLPSGRILLVWLWNKWIPSEADRTTRDVYITYSDDDGKTWAKSQKITSMAQESNWGWTGMGPVHGIVKRSEPNIGRILFPSRHNTASTNMVSHVIYSDDNGTTWHIGGSTSRPKTTESTVVELSNGDIMLNSRNQNDVENHRVVSISKDGGRTFSQVWLEKQLPEPRGVQASLLFYGMNAKTGKGNILFSNPNDTKLRTNGTLRLSTDDGKTWSESVVYAPKKSPYFTGYSDLAVLPSGDIAVLFERGNYDEKTKGERYEEIGFSIVSKNGFSLGNPTGDKPAGGDKKQCLIENKDKKNLFKDETTKSKCEDKCKSLKKDAHTCEWGGKQFWKG